MRQLRWCSRASNQHKIIDLVAKIPEFIDEMEHLELRSHDYFQITPGKLLFARDVSTYIAISVSFIVIGFYKYERLEKAKGFWQKLDRAPSEDKFASEQE